MFEFLLTPIPVTQCSAVTENLKAVFKMSVDGGGWVVGGSFLVIGGLSIPWEKKKLKMLEKYVFLNVPISWQESKRFSG